MSMTREQAYDYLRNEIENAHRFSNDHQTYHESLQALSILAPEPRKEPPTKEEVGDEDVCWYHYESRGWFLSRGVELRDGWEEGEQWLPLSALPKGDV